MSGHAAVARWPLADTKDGNWMRQIGRQGLYVGRDGVPKDQLATGRPYHETEGNYDPAELPQPTADLDQLRHDMAEFGYCLVKEALNPEQLRMFQKRLSDQAEGERRANVVSSVSSNGVADGRVTNQLVYSLVNKGQCFLDMVELKEEAVAGGPMIDQLCEEMLGPGYILNTLAAWIAGKGGNPQALHCGQGMVPKPWPPWPFEVNVAFPLDDFSAVSSAARSRLHAAI